MPTPLARMGGMVRPHEMQSPRESKINVSKENIQFSELSNFELLKHQNGIQQIIATVYIW